MTRIPRTLAGAALGTVLAAGAGGYAAGHFTAKPASCPAPVLSAGPSWTEPYAGYVASGTRIVGVNGGNGVAPGDVFTCENGHSEVH